MAFPTSSLTNNQVHKEGNRAFVYDSALGVWDQVRETDSSGILRKDGESISQQVVFPAGHVINYDFTYTNSPESITLSSSGSLYSSVSLIVSITPKVSGNKLVVVAALNASHNNDGGAPIMSRIKRTGPSNAYSPEGASGSNTTSSFWYGGSGVNKITTIPMTILWEDTAQDNTTSHSYAVQLGSNSNGITGYLNRRGSDTVFQSASSIYVMEVQV